MGEPAARAFGDVIRDFNHMFWGISTGFRDDLSLLNKIPGVSEATPFEDIVKAARAIPFPYTVTFVDYTDYNICTGCIQPITRSPLIELCVATTYGQAFDAVGDDDGEYPDGVFLRYNFPDDAEASHRVIVSRSR